MNGPNRVYIWISAVIGASLPYLTLYFFLPHEMLESKSKLASGWIFQIDLSQILHYWSGDFYSMRT